MDFAKHWIVLCAMILLSEHEAGKDRGKKRRRASENFSNEIELYKGRSLEDWEALSRPALALIIQQQRLIATGTRTVLADRLFNHFQRLSAEQNDHETNVNDETVGPSTQQIANTDTEATRSSDTTGINHNTHTDINALRQDLFNLVSTQMESAMTEMNRQMATFIKNNSNTPVVVNNNNREDLNMHMENQVQGSPTVAVPQHTPPTNYFRLPSMSASNLALIKAGKFINFDFLLPGSLAHTSSGYSVHFHSPSNGVEGDTPFSLQPHAGRRTVKSFTSWLSAWNIFFQAFCYFFPSFAGSLLAYQSQLCIYASRYEFTAWSTYDRNFRQNMANVHPNSLWGEVDRHLFDEILLCAPVLAVCYTCREVGHYYSACPSRSQIGADSTNQQPFLSPQRPSASHFTRPRASTPRMLRPFTNQPPLCRYFNAGSCTFHACTYIHQCNICRGPHPASKCTSKP